MKTVFFHACFHTPHGPISRDTTAHVSEEDKVAKFVSWLHEQQRDIVRLYERCAVLNCGVID